MDFEVDPVPLFGVTVAGGDADRLVRVTGEVDLASAPYLDAALMAAVDGGQGPVIVDLAEVTFMDSTGLGVLISAHNRLASEGRQLRLRSPSDRVVRVLDVSGLNHLFQIETDSADADHPA